MKIVYINGFNGENSSKAKILKEKYNAEHIVLKNDFNPSEVCQKLKEIKPDPDIVVASSTGCFVADSCKYDEAKFIYLNPLVDLDDLAKLTDISKLQNLTQKDKTPFVFVNEDDELLDYKKAYQKYQFVFSFKKGGHRFENIDDLFRVIECSEYFMVNENFRKVFSYEEFCRLFELSTAMDRSSMVILTNQHFIEISTAYNENRDIQIFLGIDNEDSVEIVDKDKLFQVISNEEIKKAICLSIDK